MSLRQELLKEIDEHPLKVREILNDPEISEALSSIGVLPKILELHAPSSNARKKDGVGKTLCGIKGTRHTDVTCQRCLQSMK